MKKTLSILILIFLLAGSGVAYEPGKTLKELGMPVFDSMTPFNTLNISLTNSVEAFLQAYSHFDKILVTYTTKNVLWAVTVAPLVDNIINDTYIATLKEGEFYRYKGSVIMCPPEYLRN